MGLDLSYWACLRPLQALGELDFGNSVASQTVALCAIAALSISFIRSILHSNIHSFIHSFIHSSIHPFIHSSIHPFIFLPHPLRFVSFIADLLVFLLHCLNGIAGRRRGWKEGVRHKISVRPISHRRKEC